jgi:hypothetical protein
VERFEANTSQAIEAGKPEDEIFVVSPEGQGGTIQRSQLDAAMRRGFRIEQPDETQERIYQKKYGDAPITTAIESAADMATFGLSPWLEKNMFNVDPVGIEERRKRNTAAAVIGGIGGIAVDPFGVAGAISGAGKLAERGLVRALGTGAEAVGASRALRVAGKVVGGATEGAAYGLGKSVSESALNATDPADFAERVWSSAGQDILDGAKFGGAIGGVMGAGGELVDLAGIGMSRSGGGLVRRATEKAVAAQPELRDALEIAATREGRASLNATRKVKDIAPGIVKVTDSLGQDALLLGESVGTRYRSVVDDLYAASHPGKDLSKVSFGSRARAVQDMPEFIAAEGPRLKNLHQNISKLKIGDIDEPFVKQVLSSGDHASIRKLSNAIEQRQSLLSEAESLLGSKVKPPSDEMKQVLDRLNFEEGKRMLAAAGGPNPDGLLAKAGRASEMMKLGDIGGAGFIASSAASAAGIPLAKGLVALKTVGGMAKWLNKANDPFFMVETLARLESLSSRFGSRLDGALGSLSTATKVVGSGGNPMRFSRPSARSVVAGSVTRLADTSKGNRTNREDSRREYSRRVEQVVAMSTSTANHVPDNYRVAAPIIAAHLHEVGVRAASYLAGLIPPDPRPPLVGMVSRTKHIPPDAQVARFMRAYGAVTDPVTAIVRGIAHGTLTRDAVEAVKTVFPRLFAEIQSRVTERIPSLRSTLPYSRRLQLGLLLGVPVDRSMEPSTLSALQGSYASGQGPEQDGGMGGDTMRTRQPTLRRSESMLPQSLKSSR